MEVKVCRDCGEEKPFDAFHRHPGTKDGRGPYCRQCHARRTKAWQADNRTRMRILQQESYTRHRDTRIVALAVRKKAKREQFNDYERTRRARKRRAFVEHVTLETVYASDHGVCWLCGGYVSLETVVRGDRPSMDHVTPLAKGGEHSYSNVRLAHQRCNSRKKDRLLPNPTP